MDITEKQAQTLNFFYKQQDKEKISHAYLLVGNSDTQTVARLMAQALLCPRQKTGHCNECSVCQRVADMNHPDLIRISGKNETIKKEAVIQLKDDFNQTAMEGSRKVYIIEDIDNITLAAINGLLTFLEEPQSDIVAILTTSTLNLVLPTIQSRCLILNLETADTLQLQAMAKAHQLSPLDVYYLTSLFDNEADIVAYSQSKVYHTVVDVLLEFIQYLDDGRIDEAIVFLQIEGIKAKKLDRESFSLFCDLFKLSFLNAANTIEQLQAITTKILDTKQKAYAKIALSIKDRIRSGINTNFLIDQLGYEIKGANQG